MESLERLQRYIYQYGMTENYCVKEIPVGVSFTSDGKAMVKFTTSYTKTFDTVEDALNYINIWLDEREE